MTEPEKKKLKGIRGRSTGWCFGGLLFSSFMLFFVASHIAPAAKEVLELGNGNPELFALPYYWSLLFSITGWGILGVICSVIAQACNKRLVNALYGEE